MQSRGSQSKSWLEGHSVYMSILRYFYSKKNTSTICPGTNKMFVPSLRLHKHREVPTRCCCASVLQKQLASPGSPGHAASLFRCNINSLTSLLRLRPSTSPPNSGSLEDTSWWSCCCFHFSSYSVLWSSVVTKLFARPGPEPHYSAQHVLRLGESL